jgi:hypothetical protein
MKGIQLKEYVKVTTTLPGNWRTDLTCIGTGGPQGHRPPHAYSKTGRIPHRDPCLGNQLLRSAPDPGQVPAPACLPMGRRVRVLRCCPEGSLVALQWPHTQVQGGRQGVWRVPGRVRNAHCVYRGAAAANA